MLPATSFMCARCFARSASEMSFGGSFGSSAGARLKKPAASTSPRPQSSRDARITPPSDIASIFPRRRIAGREEEGNWPMRLLGGFIEGGDHATNASLAETQKLILPVSTTWAYSSHGRQGPHHAG